MRDDVLNKVKNLLILEGDMYKTLRKMVSRELEAILLHKNMEELLSILTEKQEVISRLQLLADSWLDALPFVGIDELRGTSGFWNKLEELFSEEQAAELNDVLTETRATAEDLMEAEKSVQNELEKHVQQLREKMLELKHGRSAVIGYAKMGGGQFDVE
ncbi:MAG: flagellar protein FlgN [Synergistaceae bacterium]|nr:flagellar protein FlgN [Synergistaceae bacterium]